MSEHRGIDKRSLVRLGDVAWELPRAFRDDMRVPGRIYADDELIDAIIEGDAMRQLANVATVPGVVDCVYGMPDMHDGYGFPVGCVAATVMPDGIVSPGGVGFDINCGVRLLTTPLRASELGSRLEGTVHDLMRTIPSGTGRGGRLSLDDVEFDRVLVEGSSALVETRGCGYPEDIHHTEARGCISGADVSHVSARARERGRDQLGTLGAGNHFLEVQVVDDVLDVATAAAMGLSSGQVTILIHTGSRGFGHQICTDHVQIMDERLGREGITLADRQLSCAPASSREGRDYLASMACAANFAWSNRQLITHGTRRVFVHHFPSLAANDIRVLYDVAHNIAKIEDHGGRSLCVHRKGATRAFGPGDPDLPDDLRSIGQPVFIPGSMGTASYVLVGLATSEARSLGSACHGAGRRLSRTAARHQVTGAALRHELEARGIVVRCPSNAGLTEEAPFAYKDVDRVAAVVEAAGLARRVARLRPIGVVKG